MSLKYCDACHEPVEQDVLTCPKCGLKIFVHGAEIMKRVKKEEAERPQPVDSTPILLSTTDQPQRTQKIEKSVKESSNTSQPQPTFVFSKTGKTLDDLIVAQNRTTHAVRAFVRFLFIQLTGITLVYFLWNLSLAFINSNDCIRSGENCSGNAGLQFLALGVWVATVILSSSAGWDELRKSEVR